MPDDFGALNIPVLGEPPIGHGDPRTAAVLGVPAALDT
jgi:muramoyltetrapeptide carboxypeptidase LdcA involved in peptidoglycan recycling